MPCNVGIYTDHLFLNFSLIELLDFFWRDGGSETQKHLKSRMAATVEELKTERLFAIKMARLFHSEDCPDFPPADVHVQGFALDVEKVSRRAEIPELAVCLQRGSPVGDNDMHFAERFKGANQFFPALRIQLNRSVVRKCPNNLDLWYPELAGQKHGYLVGVFTDGFLDLFSRFHEIILAIHPFEVERPPQRSIA